jgi:hypothetical protein
VVGKQGEGGGGRVRDGCWLLAVGCWLPAVDRDRRIGLRSYRGVVQALMSDGD